MSEPVLIEGYASLFGEPDLAGDIVRAGAFASSLRRGGGVPMLFQHKGGQIAGRWVRIQEDGKGLFVRGLVEPDAKAGKLALRLMEKGLLDGLSIGFIARDWRKSQMQGRRLNALELREVSLVTTPMAQKARFHIVGTRARHAA